MAAAVVGRKGGKRRRRGPLRRGRRVRRLLGRGEEGRGGLRLPRRFPVCHCLVAALALVWVRSDLDTHERVEFGVVSVVARLRCQQWEARVEDCRVLVGYGMIPPNDVFLW